MTATLPARLDPRTLEDRSRSPVGPWTTDHLVVLVAVNIAGLTMIVAGWWVTSGSGNPHQQMGWLNLSVVGLVLAAAVNAWWIARGRRVVLLARQVTLPYPAVPRVPAHHTNGSNGRARPDGFVAANSMTRYHRASCMLVLGKQVQVATRETHERAGRHGCEVCEP